MNIKIIEKANRYVFDTYKEKEIADYYVMHIKPTIIYSRSLARKYMGNEEICALAAIFHDIGKLYNSTDYEKASAERAVEFLNRANYQKEDMMKVFNTILTYTNKERKAVDVNQKVLCTADSVARLICPYYLWAAKRRKGKTWEQQLLSSEEEVIHNFHKIQFLEEKKICKPYYEMWRKIFQKGIELTQSEYHELRI